jgi:hypothetical protein
MIIYTECFDFLVVEVEDKTYNIGVVYYLTAGKVWITDILVQEVP